MEAAILPSTLSAIIALNVSAMIYFPASACHDKGRSIAHVTDQKRQGGIEPQRPLQWRLDNKKADDS
jgi:hypothetical protein